ncbi:hypothetical protein BGW37DRAFT_102527 [Umbelopsis sp. PMI_123]|nr:hypothetical protein BGW37DRAFT_102527 [Umbelopsis sp. PMI_123]
MKVCLPLLAVTALATVVSAAECDCDADDTECLQDCVTSTNKCLENCGADTNCYTGCVRGWPGADNAPQNYRNQDIASSNAVSSTLPAQSLPPFPTNLSGSSMLPSATMSGSMRMGQSSVPFGMPSGMSSAGAAGNNQRWNPPMNTADKTNFKYIGTAAAILVAGMIIFA